MISRKSVAALFVIGLVGVATPAGADEAQAIPLLTHAQYQDFAPLQGLSYDDGDITGTVSTGIPLVMGSKGQPRAYVAFDLCGPASWAAAAMPVIVCE